MAPVLTLIPSLPHISVEWPVKKASGTPVEYLHSLLFTLHSRRKLFLVRGVDDLHKVGGLSSPQSPLRAEHPSGISYSAPLRLLSKWDPLRWAPIWVEMAPPIRPPSSSSQSPLRSGRPGVGIPPFAPLLLLSQRDPLRWALVGSPKPTWTAGLLLIRRVDDLHKVGRLQAGAAN